MTGVDWTPVVAAVATGVAAVFAAVVSLVTRREVKSGNGARTGKTVSDTHEVVVELRQAVEDLQVLVRELSRQWSQTERRSARRR